MDVRGFMRRSAIFHAGREAIVHGDDRLTFAQAWERGLRLANGLLAMGLRPGDRVGVLEDNCLSAADAFLGPRGGQPRPGAALPAATRAGPTPTCSITPACRALLVTPKYADAVAGLEDEVASARPHRRPRRRLRGVAGGPGRRPTRTRRSTPTTCTSSATPPAPPGCRRASPTPITPGWPPGGTGSTPGRRWRSATAASTSGPISHASGYLFIPVWLAGGSNVMLDHFDAERVPRRHGARAHRLLVRRAHHAGRPRPPPERQGPRLERPQGRSTSAAPRSPTTPPSLAHEVFGDALYQIYGQTEAVPVTMMSAKEWFAEVEGSNPLRSAGRPLPFADARDPSTTNASPLPDRRDRARSPSAATGRWSASGRTRRPPRSGWSTAGSSPATWAGSTHNGYVYILDRKHDMIVSGGFNIWPAELENAIADHPGGARGRRLRRARRATGARRRMAVCSVDGTTPVTEDEIIAPVPRPARLLQEAVPGRVHHRAAAPHTGRQARPQGAPGAALGRRRPPRSAAADTRKVEGLGRPSGPAPLFSFLPVVAASAGGDLLDGAPDAEVGAAPAQVAAHRFVDVGVGRDAGSG